MNKLIEGNLKDVGMYKFGNTGGKGQVIVCRDYFSRKISNRNLHQNSHPWGLLSHQKSLCF